MELTARLKATKKKKGFTLIELMIVLAIIAILAIVLIPKASIFKGQAKNSGVTTNVNTVRAYLQTKIKSDGSYFTTDELQKDMINSFDLSSSGTDVQYSLIPNNTDSDNADKTLINPIDEKSASVVVSKSDPAAADLVPGSVVIVIKTETTTGTDTETTAETVTGYEVYGVDNGKNKISTFTVE